MATIEHNIQTAFVTWFGYQYPRFRLNLFAVPNGAKRSRWERMEKKQEGMTAGVADMILLVPSTRHHGLCLEFKKAKAAATSKTYQTPEQRAWQAAVEAQGYRYEVVRSFEEACNVTIDYMRE